MRAKRAPVTVDLADALECGSVSGAVKGRLGDEVMVADPDALGGQTFSTSGPGPGWTRRFTADDYATAAIRQDVYASGCDPRESRAMDPDTGLVASGSEGVDGAGDWDGSVEWGDGSEVRLEVPADDEALDHPDEVLAMLEAVARHHHALSDVAGWRRLVRRVRAAAETWDDFDLESLGGDYGAV